VPSLCPIASHGRFPGRLAHGAKKAIRSRWRHQRTTLAEENAETSIAIRASAGASARRGSHRLDRSAGYLPASSSQAVPWTFGTLQACLMEAPATRSCVPRRNRSAGSRFPNIYLPVFMPLICPRVIDLMFFDSLALWGLAQIRITPLRSSGPRPRRKMPSSFCRLCA